MTFPLSSNRSLVVFDEIDSTSEDAKRRAETGERGPLWIMARRQTAGRGRRGRSWTSEVGNLFCTLLFAPEQPASESARLSFVAALSVHDLVSQFCATADVRLKWPNDVLIDGRKCAGILLESAGEVGGVLPWVSVGIGVNLSHAPDNVSYPATALAAYGVKVSADTAMGALMRAWDHWLAVWQDAGFSPIRDAWLARAEGLGRRVTARLADETVEGVFEGLDIQGGLVLRLDNASLRHISSGEVFCGSVPV